MWVFFLKTKDEAFEAFKNFRAVAEKNSGKAVKVLRSDHGGEFMSKEFKEYCEAVGIERHCTTLYTPHQNGVVERRNRTVVEMTQSSLKEMQLAVKMWGEAVRNAVYILNRVSTGALTGQTPYEVWHTRKPDVSHIRVFGCLAHMKIPSVKKSKLDDRSMPVINLRREQGTKGYRLYDPVSKSIKISRDVVFEESKTWCWEDETDGDMQKTEFTVKISDGYDGEITENT